MKNNIQIVFVCIIGIFLYSGCHIATVEPMVTPKSTKTSTRYPTRTITPTPTITLTPTATQTLIPQATFTPLPVLENRIPSGWQRHEYAIGRINGQYNDIEFWEIFHRNYNFDNDTWRYSGIWLKDPFETNGHWYSWDVDQTESSMDILIKEDDILLYFQKCEMGKNNFWEFVITFWSYEDHWVAETFCEKTADIVIDGQSLNEIYGYTESFAPSIISEKLFYFFKRYGKVGFYYDGVEYITLYDNIQYQYCCGGADSNPIFYNDQILFHGIRGGTGKREDNYNYRYAVIMGDLGGE